eukprot:9261846-Pyramimonas_sp.AAC.1
MEIRGLARVETWAPRSQSLRQKACGAMLRRVLGVGRLEHARAGALKTTGCGPTMQRGAENCPLRPRGHRRA